MLPSLFKRERPLSILLMLAGLGVIAFAFAIDLVGIGGPGFGGTQVRITLGGLAVFLTGALLATPLGERCFDELDNHVVRVHNDDVPAPYAYNLEQEMLPNARKVCEAVRAATYNA